MTKKVYHKPVVNKASKVKHIQSIQLAGVRAISAMILKSEMVKK